MSKHLTDLKLGDVVQRDGGWCMVVELKGLVAKLKPIGKAKVKVLEVARELPSHLILEHRGPDGLKKFLHESRSAKVGHVLLDLGDEVGMDGELLTVVDRDMDDEHAKCHGATKALLLPLEMNDSYLCTKPRPDAATREQKHKHYTTKYMDALAVAKYEDVRSNFRAGKAKASATKAEEPKPKTPKPEKPVKPAGSTTPASGGWSAFIGGLVADGLKDEDILAKVAEKFPGQPTKRATATIKFKRERIK